MQRGQQAALASNLSFACSQIQTERSLNPLLIVLRQPIVLLVVNEADLQHFPTPCL
jgi:hypothetical protein